MQGMPFIPSLPSPRCDMGQGQGPTGRPAGPFGHGMTPMVPGQLKQQDPRAAMPPINMPPSYPSWQQHPMNGMQGGQLGMHGSPVANGNPISTGSPGVGQLGMHPHMSESTKCSLAFPCCARCR